MQIIQKDALKSHLSESVYISESSVTCETEFYVQMPPTFVSTEYM